MFGRQSRLLVYTVKCKRKRGQFNSSRFCKCGRFAAPGSSRTHGLCTPSPKTAGTACLAFSLHRLRVLLALRSLCTETTSANRVLVKTPFRRWTKVSEVCQGHESLRYHLDSQVPYDAFKWSDHQTEDTVAAKLDKRRAELIAKNRALITSIGKTFYLCGKQGIAIRGHRDDSMQTVNPATTHGNFLKLLRFRVEAGDLALQSHLSTNSGNAAYSCKTMQNELIFVIGDHIRN